MDRENLKAIIQQKTMPWLANARAFEADTMPVNTPEYVLNDRKKIIAYDKKIEDRIRTYAPHAGAALDVVTHESALGFAPLLYIAGAMGLGTMTTFIMWLRKSEADKKRIDHANVERVIAERTAENANRTAPEIEQAGQMAYQKSLGTYDNIQLMKRAMLITGVLGGGYLLIRMLEAIRK